MSTHALRRPVLTSMAPGSTGRPEPVRGAARLLRGWAGAFVATVLAAGSHTLANLMGPGGPHTAHDAGPAPILWILTLALAGPVCTALAGRRLSWWRLSAGVAASQLVFHWLYSATAAPSAGPGLTDPHGSHAGPIESLDLMVAVGTGTGAVAGGAAAPLAGAAQHADSPAMVVAHLLAAVVTVMALRRGELLAARVAELALGLILRAPGARLAGWVPAARPGRLAAVHRQVAPRPAEVLLSALRLRGPPTGSQLALAA